MNINVDQFMAHTSWCWRWQKTWLEEGEKKRKKNLSSLLILQLGVGVCYLKKKETRAIMKMHHCYYAVGYLGESTLWSTKNENCKIHFGIFFTAFLNT